MPRRGDGQGAGAGLERIRSQGVRPCVPRRCARRLHERHVQEGSEGSAAARRGVPPDAPPSMLQNLVTLETFSVRGGLNHHLEAAPFVTLPYGLGNGWTVGSGR